MRRTRTALATGLLAALLLSGCAGEEPAGQAPATGPSADAEEPTADAPEESEGAGESGEPAEEETGKPLPQGPFADLAFKGGNASPNGERLPLGVGVTLTLRIDSDRAGELHVHSTPEREIAFPPGQSERRLRIDQPGVVDVEDHETGKILLQLEVR